jgi:hypothetical protein
MGVLEAILALIGLVALTAAVIGWRDARPVEPPVEDLATPYREGLHAAIRMQGVAQDLEQQIYAEAAQHMEGDAKPTSQHHPEDS